TARIRPSIGYGENRMTRIALGILALSLLFAAPAEAAAAKAPALNDPLRAYYGNTYTCYWPGMWECHHWWNEDGSEVSVNAYWLSEGIVVLKALEGPHENWVSNGQWCSWNARTAVGMANAAEAQGKPLEGSFAFKKPDTTTTNNNRNGCQPIVDAQPGDHWFKLHLNGDETDQREQYTLMPGHQ